MEWLIQNAGNLLVGTLVFGAVAASVLRIRSDRQKNISKCDSCPYSGTCGKAE